MAEQTKVRVKSRSKPVPARPAPVPEPQVKSVRRTNAAPVPVPDSPVKVSDSTIGRLTEVFKLLADKNRLKIVLALASDGRMHVSALCAMLKQSQPAVSHHLTLMRMGGLVAFDRVGKNNYYFLASDRIRDLLDQFFTDAGNGKKALEFEGFDLTFGLS